MDSVNLEGGYAPVTPSAVTQSALPPKHHLKNGSIYFVDGNKWHRLGRADNPDVLRRLGRTRRIDPRKRALRREESYSQMMRAIFRHARKNAKTRGILYELTIHQETALILRANGRCEVSGIEFDDSYCGYGLRRPFVPSLDRKNAAGSYTMRNCRIVCCIVNAALSDWGDEPFRKLVAAMAPTSPA